MKTLIISDLHLNTHFDESMYDYIVKLLDRVDQVVINGDFWDYYLCTFEEFVNSKWSQLFPKFKEKNTIYVYGNHDKSIFADERTLLFSHEQRDEYTLHSGDKKYIIEHGHRVAPEMDDKHPTLTRIFDFMYPRFYFYMMRDLPITRFVHRKIIFPKQEKLDVIMQEYVAGLDEPDVNGYVFGHSHIFDEARIPKYYNSGSFWGGIAHYLVIEDGIVSAKEEQYW